MKRRLTCLALSFFLLTAAACAIAYMRYVAREDVEQTELEWHLPGWKGGMRLAVLADMHARPEDGEYLDRLVRLTLALQPDAILLLGDFLNGSRPADAMPLKELARRLQPLAEKPCYAVLGNHDHYHGAGKIKEMLDGLGITLVEGTRAECKVGEASLDIGGIRCLYTFSQPGEIPRPREGTPMVLLSHSPMGAAHAPPGTLAVLSGHTHGGQICWQTGRPICMAGSKTPAAYASGSVTVKGNPCYVSRGLGTSLLPLRLFCRPELLLIRITGKE